jgi:hypothetical protein
MNEKNAGRFAVSDSLTSAKDNTHVKGCRRVVRGGIRSCDIVAFSNAKFVQGGAN